jgi:DNA-directed RNA polymerase alpha subunit
MPKDVDVERRLRLSGVLRRLDESCTVLTAAQETMRIMVNELHGLRRQVVSQLDGQLAREREISGELELSSRAQNTLRYAGISTVDQLCVWPARRLLKLRNLGKSTIEELQVRLAEKGRVLAEEDRPLSGVIRDLKASGAWAGWCGEDPAKP